jgi:hypothetical protein
MNMRAGRAGEHEQGPTRASQHNQGLASTNVRARRAGEHEQGPTSPTRTP